jgi:transposase
VELARLRAENKKLKAGNTRLELDLGKTRTALDIAGKAFALLEDISGSADSGTS